MGLAGGRSLYRLPCNAKITQHASPPTKETVIITAYGLSSARVLLAFAREISDENRLLAKWISTPVQILPVATTK